MRRIFFITVFCLGCTGVFAQSITINDLTNLTNLNNGDAHNYLVLSKGFKKKYIQDVNGNTVEHLNKTGPEKKEESVAIGVATKLSNGAVLRTVTYKTVTTKHIFNLITQAKSAGLAMKFQGVDIVNNIYIFDSDFFHIVMYISRDNSSGFVEVKQKEYVGFD